MWWFLFNTPTWWKTCIELYVHWVWKVVYDMYHFAFQTRYMYIIYTYDKQFWLCDWWLLGLCLIILFICICWKLVKILFIILPISPRFTVWLNYYLIFLNLLHLYFPEFLPEILLTVELYIERISIKNITNTCSLYISPNIEKSTGVHFTYLSYFLQLRSVRSICPLVLTLTR